MRNDDRGFEPNGAARAMKIAEMSGLLGQFGATPQGDASTCLGYFARTASLRGGRQCRAAYNVGVNRLGFSARCNPN